MTAAVNLLGATRNLQSALLRCLRHIPEWDEARDDVSWSSFGGNGRDACFVGAACCDAHLIPLLIASVELLPLLES